MEAEREWDEADLDLIWCDCDMFDRWICAHCQAGERAFLRKYFDNHTRRLKVETDDYPPDVDDLTQFEDDGPENHYRVVGLFVCR